MRPLTASQGRALRRDVGLPEDASETLLELRMAREIIRFRLDRGEETEVLRARTIRQALEAIAGGATNPAALAREVIVVLP